MNYVKFTWMSVTTGREEIVSEGWAECLWGDLSISSKGMIRRGWTEVMAWNFQSHCPNNSPGGIWEQCPTNQLVKNILNQAFQLKKQTNHQQNKQIENMEKEGNISERHKGLGADHFTESSTSRQNHPYVTIPAYCRGVELDQL